MDARSEAVVVLLRHGVELRTWPLEVDHPPDLTTVDALARHRLRARRAGCTIRVRNCPDDLRDLLRFVGLAWLLEG